MKIAFILVALLAVALLVFFVQRRSLSVAKTAPRLPSPSSGHTTYFVYAKISDTVLPLERSRKYGDPLDELLQKQHLGEVTGGGTMQRKDKSIEYVGLDLELTNLDSALEVARMKLRELGAPAGSALEFQRDGQAVVMPIHPL